ncbi:MAG: hypothetical protein MUC83_18240 [Pirellula sp.]|nr:hypothetical protein [Pirellula sp.]
MLVRRDVYEELGGYRSDLRFALDWEMWVRIAAHYAVWYDPKVLAIYRRHAGNETARLAKIGITWSDLLDTIHIIRSYLPPERAEAITEKSLRWHTHSAIRSAKRLLAQGEIEGCQGCLNAANRFCEYSHRIAVRTKLKLAVLTAIVNKQTYRKSA